MALRKEHAFKGTDFLCSDCALPAHLHRLPRVRVDPRHVFIGDGETCSRCDKPPEVHPLKGRGSHERPIKFFGIDGEGQGRYDHLYVLLAIGDAELREKWHIENHNGLSTQQCLEFMYALKQHVKLFAYSFNYDLTKILTDLDDEALYELFRPENRQRHGKDAFKGPRPVFWNGWLLNLQGTKFSFKPAAKAKRKRKTIVCWDIWKFYQAKFTNACTDWKVGTPEEITHMIYMKDHRHEFDKLTREAVRNYCYKETSFMAQLATELKQAHTDAGLELASWYGAGSTATAFMKKHEIQKFIKKGPSEMEAAVAMAFFGGRFDNAYIGSVEGPVYSYDISSAYPYQITSLPCLVHGTWIRTTDRKIMEGATTALVSYGLSGKTRSEYWGPFPFREDNGSISFPNVSGGGWVWRDEFLAGEKHFEGVEFREAWVYHTECDCHPFKDVPQYYIQRCILGKEGAGIVIKLGLNSLYGKLAQSVGRAPFQSWIWAGMVTSGCRAQVLEAIALHKDRSNLLMIATDGIVTREKLVLPEPIDTGTNDVWECEKHKKTCHECADRKYKPLGGWEEKILKRGIFLARPGVYFPLEPTADDIKAVRGRGVGRGVILENWGNIVRTWKRWNRVVVPSLTDEPKPGFDLKGWPLVKVSNVARFCGAKTSISRREIKGKDGVTRFEYHRANGDHLAIRSERPEPKYGQWVNREVVMSFNPHPKREKIGADGTLVLRSFPLHQTSKPYKKAVQSHEARDLLMGAIIAQEQPDGEVADYLDQE
jgi:hypothetical protein